MWREENNILIKQFEFKNFIKASAFMSQVALFPEEQNHSFYLAINKADYVQNENKQTISEYEDSKDVSWISSETSRVEFWSDEDKNMDFFNEHLFFLESLSELNIELLHGDRVMFFDEN